MDLALKQRLVGASVIVAVAVIFVPMLLDGPPTGRNGTRTLEIPPRPQSEFESRLLPVNPEDGESAIQVDDPPVVRHPSPPVEQMSQLETDVTDLGQAEPETPVAQPSAGEQSPPPTQTPVAASPQESSAASGATSPNPIVPQPELSGWVVQVGWFSGEANAKSLRDRLRNAGFSAFMEADSIGGKNGFRVRVGPELERDDANGLREKLKQSLGVEGIVMAHP